MIRRNYCYIGLGNDINDYNQRILKNKNTLVLGGSGFIGSNLINALTNYSSNLKGTYLNNKPRITDSNIEWVEADLTDPRI